MSERTVTEKGGLPQDTNSCAANILSGAGTGEPEKAKARRKAFSASPSGFPALVFLTSASDLLLLLALFFFGLGRVA
jgi:hypothetical protein